MILSTHDTLSFSYMVAQRTPCDCVTYNCLTNDCLLLRLGNIYIYIYSCTLHLGIALNRALWGQFEKIREITVVAVNKCPKPPG